MTDQNQNETSNPIQSPTIVDRHVLNTIEYKYKNQRDIIITIKQPEYTSVCPMTGLPDYGCISINYRPKEKLIELKSLKLYLVQYRNVGIFYEHVVNQIMDDLVSVLDPNWMQIIGDFTARGGITTQVRVLYRAS
ncbi:MAG: NADPH-dependent 7-cyano-7-deazaguanine reductase QueF [Desulfobacterales bacterium]|nr:NADPH-dependent 7-cyano-7-deazaguanine reductase QueF [Desulfobacterales bacterium]